MSIFKNQKELLEIADESKGRAHVLEILEAGVSSVLPSKIVKELFLGGALDLPPKILVFGWGKASAEMFDAFFCSFNGEIVKGHLIVPPNKEYAFSDSKVEVSFGAHPLPDESSLESGEILLEIAKQLGEEDTLVCLISGGGSSMLEVPKDGVDLEDLRATYKLLIESGADIHEINSIRRALSQSKGGGLAEAAYPARIINIVISDVLGNDLEDISSGSTVRDPFRIKPLEVIKKYKLDQNLDKQVIEIIQSYRMKDEEYFKNVKTHIIADNDKAQEAMLEKAISLGYNPTRFEGYLFGEARNAVNDFMETQGDLIIGGGETTVTVKGKGRGGRNQEFVLAGLKKLENGILASMGTDGVDGTTEAAGAIGDEHVIERAHEKDYQMDTFLDNNDSYEFFKGCGGLIMTGATDTNVADISVFLKNV